MNNKNGNKKLNGNGNGEIKEFDFGDTKTAKSMIKALTLTRKRLYPERYDCKGRLKAEYAKNKVVI
jgi:hypothetical protein